VPGRTAEIQPWALRIAGQRKLCVPSVLCGKYRDMGLSFLLAETQVFGLSVHPWKIVGWSGSLVFGIRFFIQWIASERAKKSVIPFGFWECSALGSILMLSYFAIYQRDSVGVLATAMPLPIYLRNLYFRYTHREPKHPGNAPRPPE
jgi:lipid-A-disaccharide synthase-like uncharacterized protein